MALTIFRAIQASERLLTRWHGPTAPKDAANLGLHANDLYSNQVLVNSLLLASYPSKKVQLHLKLFCFNQGGVPMN